MLKRFPLMLKRFPLMLKRFPLVLRRLGVGVGRDRFGDDNRLIVVPKDAVMLIGSGRHPNEFESGYSHRVPTPDRIP